jgi:hypothetical protein
MAINAKLSCCSKSARRVGPLSFSHSEGINEQCVCSFQWKPWFVRILSAAMITEHFSSEMAMQFETKITK